MATKTFYRGINTLDATPSGAGGELLIDNDTALRDGWYPLTKTTHWDDQAASTSTITMNADLTAWLKAGMPIKFKLSGTYYYAVLTISAAGLLTIAGAPLTTGDGDLEELYVGDPDRVVQLRLNAPGAYAEDASSTLLAAIAKSPCKWGMGPAHLVRFEVYADTDGDGGHSTVNVMAGAAAISTSNTNNGLEVSAAQTWYATAVDINTTNYVVAFGDAIDLKTLEADGADDLTVIATFVLD